MKHVIVSSMPLGDYAHHACVDVAVRRPKAKGSSEGQEAERARRLKADKVAKVLIS